MRVSGIIVRGLLSIPFLFERLVFGHRNAYQALGFMPKGALKPMPNILRSRIAKTGCVALFVFALAARLPTWPSISKDPRPVSSIWGPLRWAVPSPAWLLTGASFGPTATTQVTLGAFNLNTLLAYFNPLDFRLSINFVGPNTGGTTFGANLSGLDRSLGERPRLISTTPPNTSHFRMLKAPGVFYLTLSDVRVSNGSAGSIIGKILTPPSLRHLSQQQLS